MSFCAASCCTCSPKVSCVSETSASWPTANVPPPCHFASNCSAWHRKPTKRSPPPVRAIFGLAPSVVGRCWSSKDSPLLKSNFVLHRWSKLRHEATLSNSKARFDPLRTCVPCRGTDLLFQLCNHALHDPFSQQPASGLILSRVALCRTASAQLDAAPSHH